VNQVDLVVVALLLLFALRGYWRGFLREGFALVGLVAGMAAAAVGWPDVTRLIVQHGVAESPLADILAVSVLFLVVYVAARIIGRLADRLARAVHLGGLNRVVGLGFGVAKGVALVALVLFLMAQLAPSLAVQKVIDRSALGPPLIRLAARIVEAGRASLPLPAAQRQAI
jgi:membrane protein required for colicin V production